MGREDENVDNSSVDEDVKDNQVSDEDLEEFKKEMNDLVDDIG